MRATWRWFGPRDTTRIEDIMQASVTSVETSLGDLETGSIWPLDEIRALRQAVEHPSSGPSGLKWDTLGGIPIHDDIKLGLPTRKSYIDAFKENVRRLSGEGVRRILFTVMPLLDWVRTDLSHKLPNGAEVLGFDMVDFAVFDIHLLRRKDAEADYGPELLTAARERYRQMPQERRQGLLGMLTRGLPGGPRHYETPEFAELLAKYGSLEPESYRANLIDFLGEVAETCAAEGAVAGFHPDDPPFPICGLPRIASSLSDFRKIFDAVSSPGLGFIFCSGSLGSRPDNDHAAFVAEFGSRIVYAHPRRVKRLGPDGSFIEAQHLDGEADFDLYDILKLLTDEEKRRRSTDPLWQEIPFRADHAARLLHDQAREDFVPGYTPIGITKATAELRGMLHAIEKAGKNETR